MDSGGLYSPQGCKESDTADSTSHTHRDFPGGPVAQNPRPTPMQGTWVQSLAKELDLVCHNSEFACCI